MRATKKDINQLRQEYDLAPMSARLGVHVAAAGCGLASRTLQNMRFVGKGPRCTRLGSKCLYVKRDVEQYIAMREVRA